MLHPHALFHYVGIVPHDAGVNGFECCMRSADWKGEPPAPKRPVSLVGLSPTMRVTDGENVTTLGGEFDSVSCSRITLEATDPPLACCAAAAFKVDRRLIAALRAGDVFHCARQSGGVGLSVIRDRELLLACGAVTAVPCGRVKVTIPWQLMQRAEVPLQSRDSSFAFPQHPLQFEIDDLIKIMFLGRFEKNEFRVRVFRPFGNGRLITSDECVAINRLGMKLEGPVHATSLLLSKPSALSWTKWPGACALPQ